MTSKRPIATSVAELIGGTPLCRLVRVVPPGMAEVLGKLEYLNPGGSVKDRTALALVEDAEEKGKLTPGSSTIIEPTSGNTGISLAMLSARRGYRCILVMPDDMSLERRYILRAYGAELQMTPAEQGMAGAVRRAEELVAATPGGYMPQQFKNAANPLVHYRTTGPEIWTDSDGIFDALVAGVGTGGTISGTGRYLREKGWAGRIYGVEPKASSVLSGGPPGLHAIQGIGAGFVPEVLTRELIDEIVPVSDPDADRMVRRLAREEGLLLGISAGAAAHAACQIAERLGPGKRVIVVLPDSGERYLF